ncbi:hypothetical protein C8A05DRAFT_19567 [Staphylotrichum tortipilum]|uniref:RGS domain-containing protein n=1 Tax=Staphylotrichum tortipilum TaxID=2831512 RepID=A0AAN6MBJ9_9PEZI|nr:hypothetical protein C8A05DRAFT_19567 [Staphylotrichum longicolle]
MADSEPSRKPKPQYGDIPAEISFQEVVRNRTSPPCSLTDFMDYLLHVEHNAEPLQFFLWYWDYLERWSALLPRQKALSPPWDPDTAAEPPSRFIRYSHKRERSRKMNKVIAIMEMGSELALAEAEAAAEKGEGEKGEKDGRLSSSSSSSLSSTRTSILSPTSSSPGADSQPFTLQPYHSELAHLTRHYLSPSPSTPRLLALSPSDRAACLRAAQHTTHPSALLPAFLAADATLRARSHPAFARWARRNVNKARVRFLVGIGVGLVLMGCLVDVLLVLAGVSVFWRVGLRAFGPANDYSGETWKGAYHAKGWMRRVFDDTVVVQSKALAMWQDRAVMLAVLWGGAGATALTVVSLFIPSVRLL